MAGERDLFSESYYEHLQTVGPLTDLVAVDQLYRIQREDKGNPQIDDLPALTFMTFAVEGVDTHNGPSNLARTQIQHDAHSEIYAEAEEIVKVIRSEVLPIRTKTIGSTNPHYVNGFLYEDQQDVNEPDAQEYRVRLDLACWHEERIT